MLALGKNSETRYNLAMILALSKCFQTSKAGPRSAGSRGSRAKIEASAPASGSDARGRIGCREGLASVAGIASDDEIAALWRHRGMRLRYTRRAQRDISQILTYLEGRSPAGSEHVVASLQASLNLHRRIIPWWKADAKPDAVRENRVVIPKNLLSPSRRSN